MLTQEQSETLAAELVWRFYQTAEEVCGFVAARFGLGYTLNAMAKLLNRLGFAWKSRQQLPSINANRYDPRKVRESHQGRGGSTSHSPGAPHHADAKMGDRRPPQPFPSSAKNSPALLPRAAGAASASGSSTGREASSTPGVN